MEKFFYRVIDSDSVLSLAARFNVPPIVIIKDNALTAEVRDGDVVFIQRAGGKTYTATPFDTVESVAEKFRVEANAIRELNGVEYLFYGLTVVIPE